MIMVNTMIVPDMVKQTLSNFYGNNTTNNSNKWFIISYFNNEILTRVKKDKVKQ